MRIIGVDVGYSKTRKSTGVACLDGDSLVVYKAGTNWQDRRRNIPDKFRADMIAIDGPLLPSHADASAKRCCESLFSRRLFQKRCKPGMSHFGSGLQLREAAKACCSQFSELLSSTAEPESSGRIRPDGPVVEAFPNAFLAVLLEDREFRRAPKFRRGQKFDWLYDHVAASKILRRTLSTVAALPTTVWDRIEEETNHDQRAALICLLTAALAATGNAESFGDSSTGWFWLPPTRVWEEWALNTLKDASKSAGCGFREVQP